MTDDDRRQLDELASQRRDVLLQRDRLQEELREVRRKLIVDLGQTTSGAKPGPAELASLGFETEQFTVSGDARAGPADGI